MDSPDTIAAMDRAAEDDRQHVARMQEHYIQFVKAVMLFNAGAVVAVLGLLQALAAKDPPTLLCVFKPYGLWAAGLYLAGIVLGASGFWLNYRRLSRDGRTKAQTIRLMLWCERMPLCGGLAFVVASVVVLRGVAASL